MTADMNDSIARINHRLFDLNLQKEESIDALSEWANENPTKPLYESGESRSLTRHINEIGAQIRVIEELKAEFETIVEFEERPDEIPTDRLMDPLHEVLRNAEEMEATRHFEKYGFTH